ncbi:hypothetical protein [Acetivibrio cellulolyticus]|uniref:hypothetical protein n=1 Tax=Acetivibrio cellulolyticus TaxID=35830 RepID=UPI0001E2EB5F|nr:hypothetical protein [Acetivibrio cellulolyticus]
MKEDYVKRSKARDVLLMIAEGIDPTSGKSIESADFLQDGRIKRCFIYVAEILEGSKEVGNDNMKFIITDDELAKIVLPDGKIGVMQFVKCVNECIDLKKSKKLTAVSLNSQLKKLGILSEETTEKGNTRTVINEKSANFGIETETRVYKNRSYEMILFNDDGKKYLLDNLQSIMDNEDQEKKI